jgi:hypothetical protein
VIGLKILFSKQGKSCYVADKERLIFCIDKVYFDINGNEVPDEEAFHKHRAEDDGWYQYWMDYEGLPEPLKAESTIEPEYEIDDVFGNYGFKNEAGEFVIEPQYAYAHNFTCGLALVNLNRTWYKNPEGNRYYENHYGYIDGNGQTVIGFQYDEAYPFNKYGVALVSDLKDGWHLIDISGNEIPNTRFPFISPFDYHERYVEFSRDDDDEALIGLYDTKERKVLIEPRFSDVSVTDDNHILVWERDGEYGKSDFRQYYINRNGELIYPWLSTQRFAKIAKPDINDVTAVATSLYTELTEEHPRSYFEHNGKKFDRKFIYGLYSSKEEFLLPQEYDEIRKLHDDIWGCFKDGCFTIVKTEPDD